MARISADKGKPSFLRLIRKTATSGSQLQQQGLAGSVFQFDELCSFSVEAGSVV